MADDPSSIPLPTSPLTDASPNTNLYNKVLIPEKELKKGLEMIDFMYDEDNTNVNNKSEPSKCSDLVPSPPSPILYPLFKHDIKEVPTPKNKSKNKQILNDSLASDNLSDQEGDTMPPNADFDPSSCPVTLTVAHQTNKVKRAIPITGPKSKTGKKLAR